MIKYPMLMGKKRATKKKNWKKREASNFKYKISMKKFRLKKKIIIISSLFMVIMSVTSSASSTYLNLRFTHKDIHYTLNDTLNEFVIISFIW